MNQQLIDMLTNASILWITLHKNDSVRLNLVNGSPQVFAGKDLEDAVDKAHEWMRSNLT